MSAPPAAVEKAGVAISTGGKVMEMLEPLEMPLPSPPHILSQRDTMHRRHQTTMSAPPAIEAWRKDYNEVRPHTSLGNRTPQEFTGAGAALPPQPPRRGEQKQETTLELAL